MYVCVHHSLSLSVSHRSRSRSLVQCSMCICARSYNMYSHWYYKRVLYFFLIPVLPHIFGAVNKHIRSIRTRVRDFMVRFYRLKLMFPLNTMMRCVCALVYIFPQCVSECACVRVCLSVLFFPFGELFSMSIALLLVRALFLTVSLSLFSVLLTIIA